MNQPLLARKRFALTAALFCCVLWGSAFPTIKAGLDYLSPTLFAGLRFTLAGIVLLVLSMRRRDNFYNLGQRCWRAVLSIGIFQTIIGYYLFFHGMKVSSAATGSIIVSSGPILVAIMAYPLLGEGDWTLPQLAGVIFGFTGVATALIKPGWQPYFTLKGEGFILLSTISLSYSSILAKKIARNVDPMIIAGGSMSFGGLTLLILVMLTEPVEIQIFSTPALALLIYSSFISATAFSLWYALLKHNPVSTISTVKFTIPIIGSVLSAIFLGEKLSIFKAAGGIMVGLGICLIFYKKEKITPAVTATP